MPLNFSDEQPFATGAAGYSDRPVTERETASRLILQVQIEEELAEAIVDTGAVSLICPARIANRINLDEAESVGEDQLVIRGVRVQGRLHRVNLTLLAEEGNSLQIEVTAFIPKDTREDLWSEELPCFLGWYGCLERVRFAVDPYTQTFFFGAIA